MDEEVQGDSDETTLQISLKDGEVEGLLQALGSLSFSNGDEMRFPKKRSEAGGKNGNSKSKRAKER